MKLFMEKGTKGVEIINTLKKHYGRIAFQRLQVFYWIKEVKSARKNLSNIPRPGRAADERPNDCIERALKKDPCISTKKIATALNVSSTTV
jgi:hypothetical protein